MLYLLGAWGKMRPTGAWRVPFSDSSVLIVATLIRSGMLRIEGHGLIGVVRPWSDWCCNVQLKRRAHAMKI